MRRGQRADINGANAGKRESGLRNRRGNNHVTTTIFAKAVSFTDDDYSTLLGFADDPNAPSNYVMLNMTNEPDEQDLGLDQGVIHIDAGGLGIAGHALVQDVNETENGVAIKLTAHPATKP